MNTMWEMRASRHVTIIVQLLLQLVGDKRNGYYGSRVVLPSCISLPLVELRGLWYLSWLVSTCHDDMPFHTSLEILLTECVERVFIINIINNE